MRTNIVKREWWQALKAPLTAVCIVIAAIVLFVIWLGVVVIFVKASIG